MHGETTKRVCEAIESARDGRSVLFIVHLASFRGYVSQLFRYQMHLRSVDFTQKRRDLLVLQEGVTIQIATVDRVIHRGLQGFQGKVIFDHAVWDIDRGSVQLQKAIRFVDQTRA